jgi:hypothetical protein
MGRRGYLNREERISEQGEENRKEDLNCIQPCWVYLLLTLLETCDCKYYVL